MSDVQCRELHIVFPENNKTLRELTERWNTLEPPEIEVVVQPAAEADVSAVVSEDVLYQSSKG